MTITTEMYLNHIREAIQTEGIHTTDIANKMALEIKAITLDQYLQAAHILVEAYLNQ
jgi:Mn-dependent DtxR family transcriptional regulator